MWIPCSTPEIIEPIKRVGRLTSGLKAVDTSVQSLYDSFPSGYIFEHGLENTTVNLWLKIEAYAYMHRKSAFGVQK
jgi:hypothetical protein